MYWEKAQGVVERIRAETRLYLPALSSRRGFSSSRVEHLLNSLVRAMPENEAYLEVGTLEGRTLEAASNGNPEKTLYGCDPCEKYDERPQEFAPNVRFMRMRWQDAFRYIDKPIGVIFYDGDHSAGETEAFMFSVIPFVADEAILVLDDWDRESVRRGAFARREWQLLREMPEYTDGISCPPNHFGYYFGLSVWGYKR